MLQGYASFGSVGERPEVGKINVIHGSLRIEQFDQTCIPAFVAVTRRLESTVGV
jgi:hypothetical protein